MTPRWQRFAPLLLTVLGLGLGVHLAVQGAVGRFAYATESAYRSLTAAREGGQVVASWLWPVVLAPVGQEWWPGAMAIVAVLAIAWWLPSRVPGVVGPLLLVCAAQLPVLPLLGDETALAALAALWLAGSGGPLAGAVAAALRWDLALVARTGAARAGALVGLAGHALWALAGGWPVWSGLVAGQPLAERGGSVLLVALVSVAAVRAGRASSTVAGLAVVAALVGGLHPAPLVLALVGPRTSDALAVRWPLAAAAVLGGWLAVPTPARSSHHELVAGHLVRLAAETPLAASPGALLRARVPQALDVGRRGDPERLRAGTALPSDAALVAVQAGASVPPGLLPVGSWTLHGVEVVRFVAPAAELEAARERLSAFADDLRVVVAGAPTSVAEVRASTDRCGPTEVFSLSGGELTSASGRLQDPLLVNVQARIQVDVALPPGDYALTLRGSTTALDGTPGRVEVHLGGSVVGALLVPEGPASASTVRFAVTEPTRAPLALKFTNDRREDGRDRNVMVSQLSLVRTASADVAERARALREALAGHDLVLVSLDTLRVDHLGTYGYPRDTSPVLSRLARSGVRMDNAVAASHWTAPSHASLLTGLHPEEHGVVDFPEPAALGEVPTLASVLGEAGYRTVGITGGGYVAASTGLNRGFSVFEEQTSGAGDRFGRAGALVPEDLDERWFLFVHTYQIHDPYDPPAPYDRWFMPDLPEEERLRQDLRETYLSGWRPSPRELEGMEALYDGEIRYTDHELGELVAALAAAGRLDRTLIVVTSDHGDEFFEHGGMSHARLHGEVIRVPLVLSHPALPGLADAVIDEVFPAVDVLPTVLDLLGVEAPSTSGVSRVEELAGGCTRATAWGSSKMMYDGRYSALDDRWHFLRDGERHLLYDMRTDRAERMDVAGEHPETLASYLEAVERWQQGLQLAAPTVAVQRGEDEREALRALGYIE